jgi:WD40 repeat protein
LLNPDELELLNRVLNSSDPAAGLPENLHYQLLLKGAVLTLAEDGSPDSIGVLLEAAVNCPLPAVQSLALKTIAEMAAEGSGAAADSLYELAVVYHHIPAQDLIERERLRTGRPHLQAAYLLLTTQVDKYNRLDTDFSLITQFFLQTPKPVRERILDAAKRSGMQNWALLITAIESSRTEPLRRLIQQYPLFNERERWLALELLKTHAATGSERAAETICQLYVQHDDRGARRLAHDLGVSPRDPIQRALFYFLTEQWDRYEKLDFHHTLIGSAYESANPSLRKRILSHSRYAGQLEWIQTLSGRSRPRWLGELDDSDWEDTIERLSASRKWDELWRLAQAGPPIWSARILKHLSSEGWMPTSPDERSLFESLVPLGDTCLTQDLELQHPRVLQNPEGDIQTITISPDGSYLAAGGSGSAVSIWQLPGGQRLSNPVILPAPSTRDMVFTSHSGYLTTANGDDQIRIFRMPEGKVIKTMSGHKNVIRSLALHPDERTLFSASFDGSLRAWRFPFGTVQQKIEQSEREIHAMTISPEGEFLLSAGANQLIRVWKWPEGKLVREIQAHKAAITILSCSSTGQLAASYGADRVIRIWNYASGKLINEILLEEKAGNITALAVHPSEQVVIAGSDRGSIRFWSVSTAKQLPPSPLTDHQSRITGLSLAANGETLVSSSLDGYIRLWNLETFLVVRLPVESARPDTINFIQQRLIYSDLSRAEQTWLRYTHELIRWRQRFDVEISDIEPVHIGEFDIQL